MNSRMDSKKTANEHDQLRELLSLAAAGVLDASDEQRVAAHIGVCPECAASLNRWQQVGANLRRLPTPQAPAALVSRTILLAQTRLAEESSRRTERRMMVLILVFSWAFVAVSWPLAQLFAHGWESLLGFGFEQGWKNFVIFTAFCWMAGAAAAILLAMRRSRQRRFA
ncbi:MAG TPA: zf-HC2 domain-containing protein [Candidatus Acidoferrales bacterium]|nr:zf-HC2 domain-containing protein [Candidatus Acidoferrales bacterium]